MKVPTVLVSSRNRGLYLWACLDALYRHTSARCSIILADMASDDPLVATVIEGFRRRGMFDQVVAFERNDPALLARFIYDSLDHWAPAFAYVESDVVIAEGSCWLTEMTSLFAEHPRLAMLGSMIDKRDFIDPSRFTHLRGELDEKTWRGLIKADSPERHQDTAISKQTRVYSPHNPAGRLLLLRTEAIAKVGLASDVELDRRVRAAGYETGTATNVRHRHLSLTQIFDYPDYDLASRDRYMFGLDRPDQG